MESPKPPKMVGKKAGDGTVWFREQLYTTKGRAELTRTARQSNHIRGISIVVRLVVSEATSRIQTLWSNHGLNAMRPYATTQAKTGYLQCQIGCRKRIQICKMSGQQRDTDKLDMTTYNYINGRPRTPFNLSTGVGMKRLNKCQHQVNPVRLKTQTRRMHAWRSSPTRTRNLK